LLFNPRTCTKSNNDNDIKLVINYIDDRLITKFSMRGVCHVISEKKSHCVVTIARARLTSIISPTPRQPATGAGRLLDLLTGEPLQVELLHD
jgi:hypothetical protein